MMIVPISSNILQRILPACLLLIWSIGFARQSDEFAAIDAHVLSLSKADASSISRLAIALAGSARNDREKARAAYRWITENISYDTHAFFSGNFGDMSAETVLKRRRAVCDGYAQLFEALTESMGLESQRIAGNSKGYGYVVGSQVDGSPNHAWNAVKINHEWRLVDCTWGAGYIDTDKKFVSHFNDFYFLTPADQFVYDHLPENPEQQFLTSPISKDMYEQLVNVQSTFFRCGLGLVSHREGVVRVSGRLEVVINAPDDVLLRTQLLRDGRTSEENRTYVFRRRGEATLDAVFPKSGSYILRLFAKRRGAAGTKFDRALDYQIYVDEPLADPSTFPTVFDAFNEYHLQLKSNAEQRERVDRSISITLSSDPDVVLIASLARDGGKLDERYTFVESENGDHTVRAIFPRPGKYVLTVFGKRRSASGNYNSVLSYWFTCTAMNDPNACYPVAYEQYHQWNARLFSPFDGRLEATKSHAFRISVPGAEAVAVVNNGKWNILKKNSDLFEDTIVLTPGTTEVFAKRPGNSQYLGLLQYETIR